MRLASKRNKLPDLDACPVPNHPSISFVAQPTNRSMLVFEPKPRNYRGDFEVQITKPELQVLMPKPRNSSTFVLRFKQETRAPRLHVHGIYRIRHHPTSQSLSHRVSNLCLIIPGPLHQISYSYHNHHHCLSCRTCYLHTTRQVNVIPHTK
jgi:hypothetical protein